MSAPATGDAPAGTTGEPRDLLRRAFRAAVAAADPEAHLGRQLPPLPRGRLRVVGAGKAAAAMARAVEAHYEPQLRGGNGEERLSGLVITRYGHGLSTRRVEVVEAAHPVPDRAGADATRRMLELLRDLGPDDRVLCLVSGGGSALLSAPEGVTLEQKAALTRELLRSGADIHEMNAVRKHLSAVKGGRLAAAAAPAPLLALILSDVVGDDLSVIASGPTVADPTTYVDALAVLDRYRIHAPEARAVLEEGAAGRRPETPKPGDPRLAAVENRLVGSNQLSLEAAAAELEAHGYRPAILSSTITGEAREAGAMHAAIARQVLAHRQPLAPPCALVSGGECTVTVRGDGRGGRNSEFALALALALPAGAPVYALAADSDGIDGSEDNAGAFVTPELLQRVPRAEARAALARNDAYGVFAAADHLLVSGPTRTNVNDLRLLLVGDPPGSDSGPDPGGDSGDGAGDLAPVTPPAPETR